MVGACGFLWHWVEHLASSDVISDLTSEMRTWAILDFVSARAVGYSVGALLISEMLRGRETEK